jgi:nitrogen fixation protein FixH
MQRELTGRHVLIIAVGAFGIIIAVNIALAWAAVATFPGIEVSNGYVASQTFEAERQAQERLGWTADTRLDGETLRVVFTGPEGQPAEVASVEAVFGRATEAIDDQVPAFVRVRQATFEAPVVASRGQWVLHLKAHAADGTLFQQRVSVTVRE